MFVVPCKQVTGTPIVTECVRRIITHHPGAEILVVDSGSEDRSYFAEVESLGAQVADIGNRQYATGAHRHAYEHHKADTYQLIADSIWLNAPLPDPEPLLTVRWFSGTRHGWGWDRHGVDLAEWGRPHLQRMGIPAYPNDYRGILGPYFSCTRAVMDRLAAVGYWDCDPTDKWQQCAMERVAGIVIAHLGYDVTVSLQGEHVGHWDPYDETVVTKLEMARP